MKQYNSWSRGLDDKYAEEGHGEFDAATRLQSEGYLELYHKPKFNISDDMSFFMIGSCFARNIERILAEKNSNVLSSQIELPQSVVERVVDPTAVMTKFTTRSMLTEVKLTLTGQELPDHGLIEVHPDRFWNPQLHRLLLLDKQLALKVISSVRKTVNLIRDADVVFITLGLTEGWWDKVLGVPLNGPPIDWRHAKKTGRFEFKNSNFDENRNQLNELIALIKKYSRKDVRIILTVSPVPLLRTFSDCDIIVSNSYSKSVLRTLAQEASENDPLIDYFPSYEMVMNSKRDLAWRHDQRHVEFNFVRHIIDKFLSVYMGR